MMWWSASYIHVELGRLGGSHSQSWLGPPSSLSAQYTTYIVTAPGILTTVLGWTLYRLWYTLTESKVVNMSWSAVSEDDSVTKGQLFYHPLATSSIFWPSSEIQGSGLRCWRDFSDLQNAALWWREYYFLKIRTMSNSMLADVEKLSLKSLDLMLKTPWPKSSLEGSGKHFGCLQAGLLSTKYGHLPLGEIIIWPFRYAIMDQNYAAAPSDGNTVFIIIIIILTLIIIINIILN